MLHIKKNPIDTFFAMLFIATPLYTYYFLINSEMYWVLVLSAWLLAKGLLHPLPKIRLQHFDVVVGLLFIYCLLNYVFLSETAPSYIRLWVFVGVFFCFYLFRWLLFSNRRFWFLFFLAGTLFIALVEGGIAFAQHLELTNSRNPYFQMTGTFFSPNFLGAYLGLGMLSNFALSCLIKPKNKQWIAMQIFLGLFLGVLLIATASRAAWLALVCSAIFWWISSKKTRAILKKYNRKTKILFGVFSILTVMGSAKFLYQLNPDSVDGRTFIAKIALCELSKKPLTGEGLFSFPRAYNTAKSNYFTSQKRPWKEVKIANYTSNPFNDYLLMLFELGGIGLLLMLLLFVGLFFKTPLCKETRFGMCFSINIAVLTLFSSPLTSPELFNMGLFTAALLVSSKETPSLKLPNLNFLCLSVLLASSLLGCYFSCKKIESRSRLKKHLDRKKRLGTEEIKKAYTYLENNSTATYYLGKSLAKLGHSKEGLLLMEKGFSKCVIPSIGEELAFKHMDNGNYKRAEEIFRFNIGLEPFRYAPKMNLLQLLQITNNKEQQKILANEILNFPVKIHSPRVNSYKKECRKLLASFEKSN